MITAAEACRNPPPGADIAACHLAKGHHGDHRGFRAGQQAWVSWVNWLTLAQASERYHIPRSTLRWHCRQGALQNFARKGGKSYEVPADAARSLARLLRTRKEALHRMMGKDAR